MSKTSATKSTSQAKTDDEKKFSSTIVTNFFNNHFRNVNLVIPEDEDQAVQRITFKNFPAKPDKKPIHNVVDLQNYKGLKDFIETYEALVTNDPNIQMSEVIDATFDMRLRACLDIADTFKVNKPENVFKSHVIPQLGFEVPKETSIQTFIEAINDFFKNEDKIKTKIYNAEFPHNVHDKTKDAKGVNVIYLQHISKYHDDVLKMVIEDELEDIEILREIQRKFAMDCDAKGADVKEKQRIALQIVHPEIAEKVINPPMIADPKHKGAMIVDAKWPEKLKAVERKGREIVMTEEEMTANEKTNVRALIRELTMVESFIRIIRGGHESDTSVDLHECLTRYRHIYDETRKFYEAHKVLKDDSYESFIKYFIETVRFIKNKFNYKAPLKTFINDTKGKVQFKFNKKLRAEIEKAINKEKVTDEDIARIAAEHKEEWMYINSPKTYDINELSIYSKIGKYANIPITKDFRIGVGIAIVAYIQDQVALIRAANAKKRDIVIYIKA